MTRSLIILLLLDLFILLLLLYHLISEFYTSVCLLCPLSIVIRILTRLRRRSCLNHLTILYLRISCLSWDFVIKSDVLRGFYFVYSRIKFLIFSHVYIHIMIHNVWLMLTDIIKVWIILHNTNCLNLFHLDRVSLIWLHRSHVLCYLSVLKWQLLSLQMLSLLINILILAQLRIYLSAFSVSILL